VIGGGFGAQMWCGETHLCLAAGYANLVDSKMKNKTSGGPNSNHRQHAIK
jgi:hypothetical protein